MGRLRKRNIGAYFLGLLPLAGMLMVQSAAVSAIMARLMIHYGYAEGVQIYDENISLVLVLTQAITLLAMGLWYYLAVVRWRRRRGIRVCSLFTAKSVLGLLLMAVGMQYLTGLLLNVWSVLSPQTIADYNTLMEDSGIGTLDFFSILASVVLAPLCEELIFRGLTVEYLKRTGAYFWVINIFQALLFGVAHLNLVQGVYAFALGLLCGYAVLRYRTVWAGVAVHFVFNGYNTLGSLLATSLADTDAVASGAESVSVGAFLFVCLFYLVLGGGLFFAGYGLTRRDLRKKQALEQIRQGGYLR